MTKTNGPVLEVQDLRVGYGASHVLKGLSLTVGQGEIVALLGANGAGKTTTLMTISGIVESEGGSIAFDGRRIDALTPEQRVSLGICQIPEGRRIFTRLTVEENLRMGSFLRSDRDAVEREIEHAYALFPILKERRASLGGDLSGGEQQMLAIGRGMLARPKLLLLDEPSLGLAPLVVRKVFDTLRRIRDEGTPLLLVEQNARMALDLADRGYVLETGRISLSGPSGELKRDERVKRAYLGG